MKGTPHGQGAPQALDSHARQVLAAVGQRWRRAREEEAAIRAERDRLIRQARAAGAGVREIARITGMDPTRVTRIIRGYV